MGVKADEDDVDESEGEYDYEALAAAMSESEDGDQESGSSDDEANEMIDAKRSKNKGGKKADADALFSGLASENSESDASQVRRKTHWCSTTSHVWRVSVDVCCKKSILM